MGNVIDTSKPVAETRQMFGRRVIKSSVTEITDENVVEVLLKALPIHALNRSEIDYLWEYYKGKQPHQGGSPGNLQSYCGKPCE